jgi:hypothetical protein
MGDKTANKWKTPGKIDPGVVIEKTVFDF